MMKNLENNVKALEDKLVLKTQQMQIMNEQHADTVNSLTDQVKRLKQTINIFNKDADQSQKYAEKHRMKNDEPSTWRGEANYSSDLDRQALVERNRQLRDEIEKVYMENLKLKEESKPVSTKSEI